jgi:hypothetical protein
MCKLSQQNKYFILLSNGHSRAIRQVENSRGLVVKAEDLCPRGPGFKPPLWRPFSGTIYLYQSLEQKLWKTLT